MAEYVRNESLPQFQPDYVISWDFSNKDFPAISITKVRTDEKGVKLVGDVIGRSHRTAGCISLRQVLEECEMKKRIEEERLKNSEHLRKAFVKKEEEAK